MLDAIASIRHLVLFVVKEAQNQLELMFICKWIGRLLFEQERVLNFIAPAKVATQLPRSAGDVEEFPFQLLVRMSTMSVVV